MPNIDKNFLSLLKGDYQTYPSFIESGTHIGTTIFAMEPHFSTLFTIEFSEKYYSETKNRYNGSKINFLLGDSSVVFSTLLPTLSDKTIFFLDAHWSSGDTGRSEKDCPLVEEITHINNLFKQEAIIIIDDYRLFGTFLNENWSEIRKDTLISCIKDRIVDMYHLPSELASDDRLILHIKEIPL